MAKTKQQPDNAPNPETKGRMTMKNLQQLLEERRAARELNPQGDASISAPIRGIVGKVSVELNALTLGLASDYKERRAQGMLF